jgi:phage repressor protein C with HTH and peptisase S24 domain
MKTTLQRIKDFIDYKDFSIRVFEMSVGMSNGSFASQLKNNKTIGVDKLENILQKYPELNAEWLLTGRGEMLKSEEAPSYVDNPHENLVTIPMVDVTAAAGHGFLNPDHPETTGEIKLPTGILSKRTGNYYCGLVRGDSMYPTLLDRDYFIFRILHPEEWGSIKDGEVYFIVDRFGEGYIKRVINRLKDENRLICTSDNKEANIPDFNIMGDAIGHIYYVECRLSNNMSNLNNHAGRIRTLEMKMEAIEFKLNTPNQS